MRFLEEGEVVSHSAVGSLLPRYPWLALGFSERRHGNLYRGTSGAPMNPLARAQFTLELEVPPERLVAPVLVHGAEVRQVAPKDIDTYLEADGLVTRNPNVYLSITAADCLPVFFVDGRNQVVGLAHAGWRGLLRGVLEGTVGALVGLGAELETIKVGIGPVIHACHYSVDLPRAQRFSEHLGADVITKREGKLFLDLERSAIRLLGRAGITPANIKSCGICTHCDEHYFSFRRDAPRGVEAMMAVIGVRQ